MDSLHILAYFYANKQNRNPVVSILIINSGLWWVGCTSEDTESQFADFSAKTYPGIYDTHFFWQISLLRFGGFYLRERESTPTRIRQLNFPCFTR
jgi:hypothetical protein